MASSLPDTFLPELRERLAAGRPFRADLPGWGRLYVDRRLPFVCVYRRPPERRDPLTARLVTTQPAYLAASGRAAARPAVAAILTTLAEDAVQAWGGFLVLEVWTPAEGGEAEAGEPETLRPALRVHAPAGTDASGTVEAFVDALGAVTAHKQPADVAACAVDGLPAPPGLPPVLTPDELPEGTFVVGLEVRPVWREADTGDVFPFLFGELRRALDAALLRGAYGFTCARTTRRPRHPQSLGRRHLHQAVREVDAALARIDAAFQFLLQVTPVNARAAWERFEASGYAQPPTFHYRPLNVDPARLKRELFAVPVERVEDPILAELFVEKQEELDRQLSMLRDRDTRRFFFESLQLYGEVEPELLALARHILDRLPADEPMDFERREALDAHDFAELAQTELDHYRRRCAAFPERARLRSDFPPGLMVSQGELIIGAGTQVPGGRANALLQHEVGTHMLTYFNGKAQPLRLLYAGLAGYEALQEGIAVLSEYLVGGLNVSRLRILAARVVAAHCLVQEASFVEVFQLLRRTHGFSPYVAFTIAMRIFRGGGFIKDVIYLRGLHELMRYLQRGGRLEPLLVGKMALHHVPIIEALERRRLLEPPLLTPRYLCHPQADDRLARVRSGLTFIDLVEKSHA